MRTTVPLLAALAILAALLLSVPASAAPSAGPRHAYEPLSASQSRLIRRCMRAKGLPTRWGGRGGQMARAAHVSACQREMSGR